MQSIEILSINKSIPSEIFNNLAIPITYIVDKKEYSNLPNYLYTNSDNFISDEKINDLISLVNTNSTFKNKNLTRKKKIYKEKKFKSKKL